MLKNIIKIAFRNLAKHKAFSLINILGLAIGLTSFLLINMYVKFERSYDNYHTDSEQLYRLTTDQYNDGVLGVRDAMSFAPSGKALTDELPEVLSYTTTYKFDDIIFRQGEKLTTEKFVIAVDSNYLDHFSWKVKSGNPKTMLSEPYSIVLTESKARQYFGESDPMGKSIELMSGFHQEFKVTGIIEDVQPNTHYTFNILISLTSIQDRVDGDGWNGFNFYTYLKLQADPDIESLNSKLEPLAKKYIGENTTLVFNLQPITDIHLHSDFTFEPEIHGSYKTVNFLEIISILILVIAWVNYINLSTARSVDRAKEVGLRKVIGAFRAQLIVQFLFDALLINIIGSIVALGLSEFLLPYFNVLIGKTIALHVWSIPSFLPLLVGFSIAGALVAGFYPALVLSGFKPVTVLKGKFKNSKGGIFLRKALVITQFTASIALIAGTLVVQDQVKYMLNKDIGIDIDEVVAFPNPWVPGEQREEIRTKLKSFKEELLQYPEIETIGSTSNLPGGGSSDINSSSGKLRIVGLTERQSGTTYIQYIDDNFIPSVDLQILEGRNFSRDIKLDTASMIANMAFLKKFNLDDPEQVVMEYIQFGEDPDNEHYPIVGVVNDFNRTSLKNSVEPTLYFYSPNSGNSVVEFSEGNAVAGMELIDQKWAEFFPDHPLDYVFIDDRFEMLYKEERQFGSVFTTFSILALIVAAMGLFGLSSFIAIQRTKEMGIRKVHGASVGIITFLFYKDFMILTLISVVLGIPAVYLSMESWLNNYSYRIEFPWIWLVVALLIVLISTFITVGYQVYKVARLNPSITLKYE